MLQGSEPEVGLALDLFGLREHFKPLGKSGTS